MSSEEYYSEEVDTYYGDDASFPQPDINSSYDPVNSPCQRTVVEETFVEDNSYTSPSHNVDMFFSCADWETFREVAKYKTPTTEDLCQSNEGSPLLKMNKRMSKLSAKTELYQKNAD